MDSASTAQEPVSCTPELLHLLRRDPEDLREFLETVRAPDLAEALRDVEPDLAAEVVGLLPFERAVELFDEPELRESRAAIVERMPPEAVGPLVNAMSADQQADLFRELPQKERERLLGLVNQYTRSAISLLLKYPEDSAGGIMTTEFVSVFPDWTAGRTLELIRTVGRAKETIYAVSVLDQPQGVLEHVVSLRELLMAPPEAMITDLGDQQWRGHFYGVWQGVQFSYTVKFSGPPEKLQGTAVIDGADYEWTGSMSKEAPGWFKGSFGGSRYIGSFNLKPKNDG